ncbi:hypothetical protein MRX96_014189 [Rhipicephalus microplus]
MLIACCLLSLVQLVFMQLKQVDHNTTLVVSFMDRQIVQRKCIHIEIVDVGRRFSNGGSSTGVHTPMLTTAHFPSLWHLVLSELADDAAEEAPHRVTNVVPGLTVQRRRCVCTWFVCVETTVSYRLSHGMMAGAAWIPTWSL